VNAVALTASLVRCSLHTVAETPPLLHCGPVMHDASRSKACTDRALGNYVQTLLPHYSIVVLYSS
jgi:hypothetical protein